MAQVHSKKTGQEKGYGREEVPTIFESFWEEKDVDGTISLQESEISLKRGHF